ncbi:MAG: polymer-forming cytoskeletal protein [Candidatus Odinarchaeota archaeon]
MSRNLEFQNESVVEFDSTEGDVVIRSCGTLRPQQGNEIVIGGALIVFEELSIEGNLRCERLELRTRDRVVVKGSLYTTKSVDARKGSIEVENNLEARDIEVGASLSVGGNLKCTAAKAGGSIKVEGDAEAQRLTGGGSVKINGLCKVERIAGGGSVAVHGKIEADELDAGGSGKAARGFIKKVSVGGSFKAEEAIEIDDLDVGGSASVGPDSKVRNVDIGGTFKAEGNLEFGEIDVGGTVKIGGNASGDSIDVGGTVKTDGDLALTQGLNVGGTVAVDGNLRCDDKIKVGGTVRVEGRIDTFRIIVGGEISATYIKAIDGFRIGKRAEVRGFVESGEILIRERARTDSLYGKDIRIEERARVGNLYGLKIYIERDAIVEGEVLYTESLESESGVSFKTEPRKVDTLPPPEQLK